MIGRPPTLGSVFLTSLSIFFLRALRFEGYVVETAEMGGEAMGKIEVPSDLAILDYKLPDTTGSELL